MSEYVLADAAPQVAIPDHLSLTDAATLPCAAVKAWHALFERGYLEPGETVLDFTEGRGVDHILELGGPDIYDRSTAAVAPGGRIAQIGVLTGFASQPNILPLQCKNASINGICVGSVEHFEGLNRFLSTHRIQSVVDKIFAFDDAPAAYAHLKSAGHFGKVVIETN